MAVNKYLKTYCKKILIAGINHLPFAYSLEVTNLETPVTFVFVYLSRGTFASNNGIFTKGKNVVFI